MEREQIMKKVIIKFVEQDKGRIVFTLPDGRKASAYEIDYDTIQTGEYADINQYRYAPRYSGDEYGFDLDEFDGEDIVKYETFGNTYDDDIVKFVKKLCMHYGKTISEKGWDATHFEMNAKYLELVTKESK